MAGLLPELSLFSCYFKDNMENGFHSDYWCSEHNSYQILTWLFELLFPWYSSTWMKFQHALILSATAHTRLSLCKRLSQMSHELASDNSHRGDNGRNGIWGGNINTYLMPIMCGALSVKFPILWLTGYEKNEWVRREGSNIFLVSFVSYQQNGFLQNPICSLLWHQHR